MAVSRAVVPLLLVLALAGWLLWPRGEERAEEPAEETPQQEPAANEPAKPEPVTVPVVRAHEVVPRKPGDEEKWPPENLVGRTIFGRVVDADRRPLAGVEVFLEREGAAEFREFDETTDEEGRFVFEDLEAGTYRVTALVEETEPSDWRVREEPRVFPLMRVLEGVAAGTHDVEIVVPGADGTQETEMTVRVRVLGPDGWDITRWTYATRSRLEPWSWIEGRVETEPGKAHEIELSGLPPFGIRVQGVPTRGVAAFSPALLVDVRPREAPYVLQLEPARPFMGQLFVGGRRSDLPLRMSYVLTVDGRIRDPEDPTLSDAPPGALFHEDILPAEAGIFTVEGLHPVSVVRFAPIHREPTGRSLIRESQRVEARKQSLVRLQFGARAPLKLVFTRLRAFDVRQIYLQVYRETPGGRRLVHSTEVGFKTRRPSPRQAFDTVPLPIEGRYEIEVFANNDVVVVGHTRRGGLTPGQGSLDVPLERGLATRGIIVDDTGAPVRGARVTAFPAGHTGIRRVLGPNFGDRTVNSARFFARFAEDADIEAFMAQPLNTFADAEGRFEFKGLAPGTYELFGESQDQDAGARLHDMVAGATDVRLVARKRRTLAGRLAMDAPGNASAFVVEAWSVEDPGRPASGAGLTTDGYFEVTRLHAEAYIVSAWNVDDPNDDRFALSKAVPGGTRGVVLRLQPGGHVAGTILDAEGRVVEGASVRLRSNWCRRGTTTDEAGRFRLHGLPPGQHAVEVIARGGRVLHRILEPAIEPVLLTLPSKDR